MDISTRESCRAYVLPQASWANGVTAALTPTMKVNGMVEMIEVKINNNTGDKTLTLTITDENSGQLYTKAGIPESATTIYNSNKATADFDKFMSAGLLTFTLTPSGDPGESGMTADIVLFVR